MRIFNIKSAKPARSVNSARSSSARPLSDSPIISGGLTVLHPSDDDGTALFDIITVHGLGGHPRSTWTNIETQHFWPQESLPVDVPKARIMTFGYSTSISPLNTDTAIVSDIANQLLSHLINKRGSEIQKRRPIIFIAHSLGGIVVKKFLLTATSNPNHQEVANCVRGILFLGTPHNGSILAGFAGVITGVVRALLGLSADTIVKDLSRNSQDLQELNRILRFKLAKIDIYSFYEKICLKPLNRLVVEKHSALLNIPSEHEQIGLDADHRQMCRPPDRDHRIYETITQRILIIMNRQIHKAQYASDLVEMTNNFAAKQMEHISTLMKELEESQIGSEILPMVTALQVTVSMHANRDKRHEEAAARTFEELLKSLPISEVESFVNGIQSLMDRAKPFELLEFMTKREIERKKYEARIEAESEAKEQVIRDLRRENARLEDKIRASENKYPGLQGLKGERGPAGAAGLQGPQGKPGLDGRNVARGPEVIPDDHLWLELVGDRDAWDEVGEEETAESTMAAQELKLAENVKKTREIVERLNQMLLIGRQVMDAHEGTGMFSAEP